MNWIRKLKRIGIKNALLGIVLSAFTFIQIYPLLYLVFFSLKNNEEIFGGNILGPPTVFRWENYARALGGGEAMRYFMNSVIISSSTILIVLILASMVAYAVTRMKWKLSKVVLTIFMMGLMIPGHVALLPLFIMLRNAGLLNTYWALILPYSAFGLPVPIMLLASFIQNIPKEMEESACIDGCGIYGMFFTVMFPLIKPGLATAAILTLLFTWNELMFAITFANQYQVRPLTAGITTLVGQYFTEWGPVGASLVIATMPTIVIYLFMSKAVQRSLIAGAIKA